MAKKEAHLTKEEQAERRRANKIKLMGLVLILIMVLPILPGIPGLQGSDQVPGATPTPTPTSRPPSLAKEMGSLEQALNISPRGVQQALFTTERGIEKTEMGSAIRNLHGRYVQLYRTQVESLYRAIYGQGVVFEYHGINRSQVPVLNARFYDYRGHSIYEIFTGEQAGEGWPWLGLMFDTDPMVLGTLSPQITPPYILGLDSVLDVLENQSNQTAGRDLLVLLRDVDLGAPMSGFGIVPLNNWSQAYGFSVHPLAGERYRLRGVLFTNNPNQTAINDARADAIAKGLTDYNFTRQNDRLAFQVTGNWTQVSGEASRWGFATR